MSILTLSQIIIIAYFLAINVYGFILINFQQKTTVLATNTPKEDFTQLQIEDLSPTKTEKKAIKTKNTEISNLKIFITSALGGALGIYIAMFIYKHKLSNFFFMVIIPIFIALSVYILVMSFINNFWIITQNPV
ncbi:MAG: hypothetical protein IJA15_04450 [Clostridia bacterium]|nr:hypothetical protein [Clostridia bacterium]